MGDLHHVMIEMASFTVSTNRKEERNGEQAFHQKKYCKCVEIDHTG
jgi:hypothetical protein